MRSAICLMGIAAISTLVGCNGEPSVSVASNSSGENRGLETLLADTGLSAPRLSVADLKAHGFTLDQHGAYSRKKMVLKDLCNLLKCGPDDFQNFMNQNLESPHEKCFVVIDNVYCILNLSRKELNESGEITGFELAEDIWIRLDFKPVPRDPPPEAVPSTGPEPHPG